MDDHNIIKDHNYVDQGTTVYNTLIKDFLRTNYFKPEPRTTLYWVSLIKEISCKENMQTYGQYWFDLIPENLSAELITEYIKDPRGTIAANRFSDEEILELRQPQRILLFYFLKKIGQYKYENPRIIKNFNQTLSKDVFFLNPRPAVPDKGFLTVENTDGTLMDITQGLILDCIVEDEQITRKYIITSSIIGHQLNLMQMYMAIPSFTENRLCVTNQELPLTDTIYPFCPNTACTSLSDEYIYYPSIIITSTLLCMSEGERLISLTIDIESSKVLEQNLFSFEITTENGWKTITQNEIKTATCDNSNGHFVFDFTFDAEFPPIAPMAEVVDEEIYLTLSSAIMMGYKSYKDMTFSVQQVDLKVSASGLRPIAIRNQEMVLNPQDDYQVFGADAELQSTFSFTHAELTHPELQQILLTPQWVAVPENLNKYYKAYHKKKHKFKVNISTVYRAKGALSYTTYFNAKEQLMDTTLSFEPTSIKATTNVCTTVDTEEMDPMNFNLYYQLQLVDQDFGQSQYPLLMTQYAVKYAKYEGRWIQWPRTRKEPDEVNMPYIPMWSELLIDYSSKEVSWTQLQQTQGSVFLKTNRRDTSSIMEKKLV
ncbi:MAG: hypothetical protein JKY02_01005 [Flavobacteriaceae bacterium]|nr:hypothetical protein [Flavobacteriaceae bacterium]